MIPARQQTSAVYFMIQTTASQVVPHVDGMTDGPTDTSHDGNSGSLAFVLVPIFFLMGLLGVLICHLLKKKGYRCTTDTEADIKEEKNGEEKTEMNDTFSECNADTVGQIVHYIMKNEANSEALKAMVQDRSIDPDSPVIQVTPSTPLTPAKHTCQSNHLHTIGGAAERNVCSRCNHKKWPLIWQGNKARDLKRIRHGEITVLSVGRFRVTKAESRSNPKQRKSLISECQDGIGSSGEVPATPTQEESKSRAASEPQTAKYPGAVTDKPASNPDCTGPPVITINLYSQHHLHPEHSLLDW
ncbi:RELT-like protein 1 isoform X2 [Polyodon spathula]|uniref:RELT-like protein 1 isoform X2 n=1 Tax=Polyodon spathula TaxID=7913 RepID=UPI001B7F7341|nr:RELT-like protein 1 isoform X2 [Polyodon spathula]